MAATFLRGADGDSMVGLLKKFVAAALAVAVAAALSAEPRPVERREVGQLVLEDIPEVPAETRARLEQFQNTRSANFISWMPDGAGVLISTRFGDTNQLHIVSQPMGARRQITFGSEPISWAAFGKGAGAGRLLHLQDTGGSEQDQIMQFDMATGKSALLTDGSSKHGRPVWSETSALFAFSSNARNGRDSDLYVKSADEPTSPPRMLLEVEGTWSPLEWSPDDAMLLATKTVSANESELYIVDAPTGARHRLNETITEPVAYGTARFSRDGKGVFFTSDHNSEFARLHYYDLKFNVSRPLFEKEDLAWDVADIALSHDGRRLVFTTNENGFSGAYEVALDSMKRDRLPIPPGIISNPEFSPDDTRLAYTHGSATSPGDVQVWDFAKGVAEQWTASETGGIPAARFADAIGIEYPTFDKLPDGTQRRIPAIAIKPKSPGPFPVVIQIHGGPEGQSRPSFDPFSQYLVTELGIAVIKPNVRGSSGYGKSFLKLDNSRLREDSVKDIGALLDWIARQPEYDASRVAVTGGSYGGYMVLASLVHYGDRLAGGIDSVGISNFVTFLESTSEYRQDLRRVEYGDERDPQMREFLLSISPTTNAAKITKPLFVVQGFNDPRVPHTEAAQIVEAVRANGQAVWYMLGMNEGHGFAKKENRDEFQAAAAAFLESILRPSPRTAP